MELVTHIENSVQNGFTFCSLCQMYEGCLQILGIGKEINKIPFKECVLHYFPNAQEQNDGKRVILVFEQGMQQILKTSQQHNSHEVMF